MEELEVEDPVHFSWRFRLSAGKWPSVDVDQSRRKAASHTHVSFLILKDGVSVLSAFLCMPARILHVLVWKQISLVDRLPGSVLNRLTAYSKRVVPLIGTNAEIVRKVLHCAVLGGAREGFVLPWFRCTRELVVSLVIAAIGEIPRQYVVEFKSDHHVGRRRIGEEEVCCADMDSHSYVPNFVRDCVTLHEIMLYYI